MTGLEERPPAVPVKELMHRQTLAEAARDEALRELAMLDEHGADHLHPNEPEARVMKTESRAFLAYNAQAVVDHEHDMVVALGLTADENDSQQLLPMLRETQRVVGRVAKHSVADTGYASGEQLHAAREAGFAVLSQPQAEPATAYLPKSSFAYDPDQDAYVCGRGELLTLKGHSKKDRHAAYDRSVYQCRAARCPEAASCTASQTGRTIKRTPFEDDLQRQRELLRQPEMRNLYSLRKEIVEHLFGCIKGNDGLRRFSVRGLAKALAHWALACLAFNLRKLHQIGAAGFCRQAGSLGHYA